MAANRRGPVPEGWYSLAKLDSGQPLFSLIAQPGRPVHPGCRRHRLFNEFLRYPGKDDYWSPVPLIEKIAATLGSGSRSSEGDRSAGAGQAQAAHAVMALQGRTLHVIRTTIVHPHVVRSRLHADVQVVRRRQRTGRRCADRQYRQGDGDDDRHYGRTACARSAYVSLLIPLPV